MKITNTYLKNLKIQMTRTDENNKSITKVLDLEQFIDVMADLDLLELDDLNLSEFQIEGYIGLILLAPKEGLEYDYWSDEDDIQYTYNFKLI